MLFEQQYAPSLGNIMKSSVYQYSSHGSEALPVYNHHPNPDQMAFFNYYQPSPSQMINNSSYNEEKQYTTTTLQPYPHQSINLQKTQHQNNNFISLSPTVPLNVKPHTTPIKPPKQSKPTPSSQKFTDSAKCNLEEFACSTGFNDIEVAQSTNQQQTNDNQASYNGKDRYKTELCRSWEETGYCRYGDKCQFAHGRQELRIVTRHHKVSFQLSFHSFE